jgi:hypothetical protein
MSLVYKFVLFLCLSTQSGECIKQKKSESSTIKPTKEKVLVNAHAGLDDVSFWTSTNRFSF